MHVGELRRYPVKSMLGEALLSVDVSEEGFVDDRAYALIDLESGRVVSAKRPKRWADLLAFRATCADGEVWIEMPDGATVSARDPGIHDGLSSYFGREVRLVANAPSDAMFDEVWASDLKQGATPYPHVGPARVEDGEELIDFPVSMFAPGRFFDAAPVHLLTTGTLRELAARAPDHVFAVDRFRPNIVVATDDQGFVETSWEGRSLAIGDVQLSVLFTVPRCVMTTLPQGDLPADRGVLRAISANNMVDLAGTRYPCAGVYATVTTPGTIAKDEPVILVDE
jgi:MOSC domain-containing protein